MLVSLMMSPVVQVYVSLNVSTNCYMSMGG